MANPLLDALGHVGYALDTPGALFRGVLSGRPGERRSGQELLTDYGLSSEGDPWGGLKGFGAEAVLDPLSIAGPLLGAYKGVKGIQAGTRAAQALAHAGDANPVVRSLAGFAGGEAGAVDPRHLIEQVANDPWFLRSHAGDLTPEKLLPGGQDFPRARRADLGEKFSDLTPGVVGDVRGIGMHADPDTLMESDAPVGLLQMMRDLKHADIPDLGGYMVSNKLGIQDFTKMSPDEISDLWSKLLPDQGMRPNLYEASVDPRGVLNVPRHEPAGPEMASLVDKFGQRIWQARQHAAIAEGHSWPDVFQGYPPESLVNPFYRGRKVPAGWDIKRMDEWLNPYSGFDYLGEHAHPMDNYRPWLPSSHGQMEHLAGMSEDFHQLMRQIPPEVLARSPHGSILQGMGANDDLLRQFLVERGYDTILGGKGGLNVLHPRAITSFDKV